MDEKRRIYEAFLAMHCAKANPTETPIAHLQFYKGVSFPHDTKLIAFTQQEVMSELDTSSELVRKLLDQMCTYQPTEQRIVGLIFDSHTVLSDVLRTPR